MTTEKLQRALGGTPVVQEASFTNWGGDVHVPQVFRVSPITVEEIQRVVSERNIGWGQWVEKTWDVTSQQDVENSERVIP